MAVTPPPTGSSPTAGVAAGTVLAGRYRLDEQLASGGMAQVWRGTDEVLRRSVAIKILHHHLASDDKFVARFRQEAIAVARLSHPGIVSVYDTCTHDGVEAIVMELVRGDTLRHRLDTEPPGAWVSANIAAQVAGALHMAHAAGLVHRDIKPANIMLSDDGRVKVGDFGIAKAAESADLTQEGSFVGTAKYLAPEQVEGAAVDGRTDLYSLGVVLYEMLCGRVPFEADGSSATALARLHQDPPRPRNIRPGVPRELETITLKLLARDPDQRYATALEVRSALLSAGADEAPVGPEATVSTAPVAPVGLPPVPPAPPDATQVRFRDTERRWLVPTLLMVLVAVSLGVAGLLLSRSGNSLLDQGGGNGGDEQTAEGDPQPVELSAAHAFDPPATGGDGTEHEGDAGLTIDGNAGGEAWETEEYHNTPDFTGDNSLKPGVGFYVTLANAADIRAVEITAGASQGWAADIYVADEPSDDLAGWGEPVESTSDGASGAPTTIEMPDGTRGSAVLVWFTRLGENANESGRYVMDVTEVRVLG